MAMQDRRFMNGVVEKALTSYRRAGFDVDLSNPSHVAAYVSMRQWCQRITGGGLLHHLKNHEKKIGAGAKVKTQFWAVPKVNFPKGLPSVLEDCVVLPDQLQDNELSGGGRIDRDTYYIFDQQATRPVSYTHLRAHET